MSRSHVSKPVDRLPFCRSTKQPPPRSVSLLADGQDGDPENLKKVEASGSFHEQGTIIDYFGCLLVSKKVSLKGLFREFYSLVIIHLIDHYVG